MLSDDASIIFFHMDSIIASAGNAAVHSRLLEILKSAHAQSCVLRCSRGRSTSSSHFGLLWLTLVIHAVIYHWKNLWVLYIGTRYLRYISAYSDVVAP